MEKLAIQRLVRGDDGLTKVIYIDLGTLQQIGDLTGYRIVNSGDLYEEPVASVEDPETPSEKEVTPGSSEDERIEGKDNDSNPNYGGSPLTPNQNVAGPDAPAQPATPGAVTQPGAIRTPESRVPSAVKPSTQEAVTPRESQTSMGPLGGIKTAQGSILSNIDQGRFNQGLQQAVEKAAGVPSVGTQDEGATNGMFGLGEGLADRPGLATGSTGMFSDSMANLGLAHGQAPKGIGRPTSQITSQIAGRPEAPIGSMPAAKASQIGQTNLSGARPEGPAAGMPAARESVPDVSSLGISRNAFDTSYGIDRGAINAGIMSMDGMPTKPSDTISAQQAALPGIQRNAYDIAYGAPKTAAPAKQTSFPGKIADDFAFADQGMTKVNAAEFDTPSKNTIAGIAGPSAKPSETVAQSVKASVAAPNTSANRYAGVDPKSMSPAKAATLGLVNRTQQEKNAIGQMIAGELAGTTLNNLTSPDSAKRAVARQELANVMTTVENRAQSQMFGSLAKTLSPTQYNSLMSENLGVTNANYAKYGTALNEAINDYYTGNLTPTNYDLTSYYNASVVSPNWGNEMTNTQKVGYHTFGTLPEYSPSEAFNSNMASMASQMDTRSQPVGVGKDAMSSPGFAVSGASRSTAGKVAGDSGSAFSGGGSYGGGGHVGGVANSGMSGASRSTAGKTSSSGIGRGSSGGSGGGNYGGGSSSYGGSAGKSASGGVSGASRSTAGKGGASPSAGSGGISGASRSTSGKTSSSSGSKSNPGTSGGTGKGSGTTSGHGAGIGSA